MYTPYFKIRPKLRYSFILNIIYYTICCYLGLFNSPSLSRSLARLLVRSLVYSLSSLSLRRSLLFRCISSFIFGSFMLSVCYELYDSFYCQQFRLFLKIVFPFPMSFVRLLAVVVASAAVIFDIAISFIHIPFGSCIVVYYIFKFIPSGACVVDAFEHAVNSVENVKTIEKNGK